MPRSKKTTVTYADKSVLLCILNFWQSHGRSPSLQEIANDMGYKLPSTASAHVAALVQAGLLTRHPGSGELMTPGQRHVQWWFAPVIKPGRSPVDEWVASPAPYLRAWRAPRTEAGVLEGDLLFIDNEAVAHKGDLVVLWEPPLGTAHVITGRITRGKGWRPDTIANPDGTGLMIRPVAYLLRTFVTAAGERNAPPPRKVNTGRGNVHARVRALAVELKAESDARKIAARRIARIKPEI